MPLVLLYLADVLFATALPCPFLLVACFKGSQKILRIVPEVKPLSMKDVILEVTVIILSIWEELKTNPVSSSIHQCSIENVTVYPNTIMAYLLDKVFYRLKTFRYFDVVLTDTHVELIYLVFYHIFFFVLLEDAQL